MFLDYMSKYPPLPPQLLQQLAGENREMNPGKCKLKPAQGRQNILVGLEL